MTSSLQRIETPALVIDQAIVQRNIERFQAHCDQHGLRLRPHIKTHKSLAFAKAQLAAGAVGINCQKISEAEVMADAGIEDILITFNILGDRKLGRLLALARRVPRLSVVADNRKVIEGLAAAFAQSSTPLSVLVECDTGGGRCGVQTPDAAVSLARLISSSAGLAFAGLLTYPSAGGGGDVTAFMQATRSKLAVVCIDCPTISSGGTPDMWQADSANIITEYRVGTYIYNDRSLVERGTCGWSDCAAFVLATVVSTPTANRAIIDAGSKALSSDLLGLEGYGHIVEHPTAKLVSLSEEHGIVHFQAKDAIQVGDHLRIIPNHVCVVSNLFDTAWLMDGAGPLSKLEIEARGCVT